jgi:hypothetical protein
VSIVQPEELGLRSGSQAHHVIFGERDNRVPKLSQPEVDATGAGPVSRPADAARLLGYAAAVRGTPRPRYVWTA